MMTNKQFRAFKGKWVAATEIVAVVASPATEPISGSGGAPLIDGWRAIDKRDGWYTVPVGKYVKVRSWEAWPRYNPTYQIFGHGTRVRVTVTGGPDRLTEWEVLPPA